jgi:hypothetical protein
MKFFRENSSPMRQENVDVACKVPEHLTTGPTGGGDQRLVSNDRNCHESSDSFRDGLEKRSSFCTNGETVTAAFNIAACENPAIPCQQGGSDFEPGIGSMGVLAGIPGGRDQYPIFIPNAVWH